jgi:hypothetical protein
LQFIIHIKKLFSLKIFSSLLLLIFLSFFSFGQSTYTANGDGAWESISWTCVGTCSTLFPGVDDDDVIIPNGVTVSVSDNNDNVGPNNFTGVWTQINMKAAQVIFFLL